MTPARDADYIVCRALIERCGGLWSKADMARAWGVSRERARQLATQPDFPERVGDDRWLAGEVQTWKRERNERHA
jgi:hypothetical protein